MKRCALLLFAALLLVCAGCGKKEPAAAASSQPEKSAETVDVGTLAIELPRGLDTAAARDAVERLPELLAEDGVTADGVVVTYGTSYAATAAALDAGGVDAAFLPAEDFTVCCAGAVPILADARPALSAGDSPSDWNGAAPAETETLEAGTFALLCAAPTEYGGNLAARAESGNALTWEELSRARWGVLSEESPAGYRCAELWLSDNYADSDLRDLDSVTVCDGWRELLQAAADGEIDLLTVSPEARESCARLWTMDTTRTDDSGARGFGRETDIHRELPCVAVLPRLYSWVTAVTPEKAAVNTETFRTALERALEQIFSGPAERQAAIGAEHYAPVEPEDLDGLRRLTLGR